MKKIVADRAKCIGGGNCVMFAPQLFSQDEKDGLVKTIKTILDEADVCAAEQAVNACPSRAIKIIDDSQ